MKINVVFVAGLYHSGSTLLDLILSLNSRVVGLGEIDRVIAHGAEKFCSCGKLSMDCPFWSRLIKHFPAQNTEDPKSNLTKIFQEFQDFFGEEKILLDSSKTLDELKLLNECEDINLKVIHLIRDVRSWTVSLIDRDRSDKKNWKYPLEGLLRSAPPRFLQWYKRNQEIQSFIKSNNISSLQMGYEELVFYTDDIILKIREFLNLDDKNGITSLDKSNSHIVRGNQMRHSKQKLNKVFYDNRWLYRSDWLLSSLLFRSIMHYNSKNVYSNLRYTAEGIVKY